MARSFNGTTALIDCGTSIGAPLVDPWPISVSAWFNPSTLTFPNSTGTYAAIVGRNDAVASHYMIYLKSTGKLGWYLNSGTPVDPGTNTISGINTWNHVAFTGTFTSAGTVNAYLNSVLDASISTILNVAASAHFQIGADASNAGKYNFPGSIADVAVWNAVLTLSEIIALSKGARPYTVRPGSLAGWLPLDGLQSPEPDLSGNAFNGTLTGTALAAGPPLMMFTGRKPQTLPPVLPPPDMSSLGAMICA